MEKINISSRGYGKVNENGLICDYNIMSFDIVNVPSFFDAIIDKRLWYVKFKSWFMYILWRIKRVIVNLFTHGKISDRLIVKGEFDLPSGTKDLIIKEPTLRELRNFGELNHPDE